MSSASSVATKANEFDQAICRLNLHFSITLNVITERSHFRKQGQEAGEDIDDYISTLSGRASTCDFGDRVDEMIKDQLVEKTSTPQLLEHF